MKWLILILVMVNSTACASDNSVSTSEMLIDSTTPIQTETSSAPSRDFAIATSYVLTSTAVASVTPNVIAITATSLQPDFIESIFPIYGEFIPGRGDSFVYFIEQICVSFDERELFEYGNSADELGAHISENTRFTVDGNPVEISSGLSLLTFSYVYDTSLWAEIRERLGQQIGPIGSVGDYLRLCFDVSDLSPGTHTATIEVTTTSGVPHSYTWEFTIEAYATPVP